MFFNITPVVINLIVINVLIFLTGNTLGPLADRFLALHYVGSDFFIPTQFFTYMFVHGSFSHLLSNMLGIFFFGPLLERHWGSQKFIIYYLITGVGAGVLYAGYVYYDVYTVKQAAEIFALAPDPDKFASFLNRYAPEYYSPNIGFVNTFAENPTDAKYIQESVEFVRQVYQQKTQTSMVGASGALYGILLAAGYIFPNSMVYLLFPPIPLKMVWLVLFYGVTSVYGMLQQREGDNVAHLAHLSGMFIGFLMMLVWKERREQ